MTQVETLLALDIETTGLNPETDRVLAVALIGSWTREILWDSSERDLLLEAEKVVQGSARSTVLVTWNGEAFDLPFLAARFAAADVASTLELRDRRELGKYGKPRYEATWDGRRHVDIAYHYREQAKARNVDWSLKPVARSFGLTPVEVDRSGTSIAAMQQDDLLAYVASDAEVTLELATKTLHGSTPSFR